MSNSYRVRVTIPLGRDTTNLNGEEADALRGGVVLWLRKAFEDANLDAKVGHRADTGIYVTVDYTGTSASAPVGALSAAADVAELVSQAIERRLGRLKRGAGAHALFAAIPYATVKVNTR